jgi:hypothetical protein
LIEDVNVDHGKALVNRTPIRGELPASTVEGRFLQLMSEGGHCKVDEEKKMMERQRRSEERKSERISL